jgi:hypothetical protein
MLFEPLSALQQLVTLRKPVRPSHGIKRRQARPETGKQNNGVPRVRTRHCQNTRESGGNVDATEATRMNLGHGA